MNSGQGRLHRHWGDQFVRDVTYTIQEGAGSYHPAREDDAGSILILEREGGRRSAVRITGVRMLPDATGAFRLIQARPHANILDQKKRHAPIWLWLAMALPLLFAVWAVWLAITVRGLRADVEAGVRVTSGLTGVAQRLLEVPAGNGGADSSATRARELARDALNAIEQEAHIAALVPDNVRQLRSIVDDPQATSMADRTVAPPTTTALTAIRAWLSQRSQMLGRRWTEMQVAVAAAAVLAFALSVVLFRHDRAQRELGTLRGIIPFCMYCKRLRDDENFWQQVDHYLKFHSDAMISHGICPSCYEDVKADLREGL